MYTITVEIWDTTAGPDGVLLASEAYEIENVREIDAAIEETCRAVKYALPACPSPPVNTNSTYVALSRGGGRCIRRVRWSDDSRSAAAHVRVVRVPHSARISVRHPETGEIVEAVIDPETGVFVTGTGAG